ncbi:NUDIX domain-containing protein [Streptomyces sp. NPDC101227]|uniref:NUDIX hydrolase n=1 Tax=Streptomyces sp. NPDC101227 TaxID=3366136 RepID=UPI0038263779
MLKERTMTHSPTTESHVYTYTDGCYRSVIGVHLVLERAGQVLLGLRSGTGWRDGHFHVPAGHLEAGETVTAGAVREAAEELGLALREQDLELVHTVHHWTAEDDPRLQLFFRVRSWDGEPANAEPDKCAQLRWFPIDALPEPMVDFTAVALNHIGRGSTFSCVGWPSGLDAETSSN